MGCENILEGYFKFLRENLIQTEEDGVCQVELPFPIPAGDFIVLSIKNDPQFEKVISDNGYVFEFLFNYGIDLWKLTADSMRVIFDKIRKRYEILTQYNPEIVIKSSEECLPKDIFKMSNIINELTSIKLLITPAPIDVFRQNVVKYFKIKGIRYISDPKINVKIRKEKFTFNLDFLFRRKNTYTKIITSDSIVKEWAVNFDQIKRNSDEDLSLWALYNDQDHLNIPRLEAFLGDYADRILAWSIDKNQFNIFR